MLRAAVEGALPPIAADAIAARGDDAGHSAHEVLLDVLQEGVRGVAARGLRAEGRGRKVQIEFLTFVS